MRSIYKFIYKTSYHKWSGFILGISKLTSIYNHNNIGMLRSTQIYGTALMEVDDDFSYDSCYVVGPCCWLWLFLQVLCMQIWNWLIEWWYFSTSVFMLLKSRTRLKLSPQNLLIVLSYWFLCHLSLWILFLSQNVWNHLGPFTSVYHRKMHFILAQSSWVFSHQIV
jgi:hypothetical protein